MLWLQRIIFKWDIIAVMPLLVDGYNVLHTTMPPSLAGLDEAELCLALGRSPWAGDGITVVFDGRVKPHGPALSPADGVELIYSGPKRSADEVIIDAINASSAPRRLVVASSDREIQKAAKRRRAKTLSSGKLISLLVNTRTARPGDAKRGGTGGASGGAIAGPMLGEEEVEQWLKQFGIDPDDVKEKKRRWWPPK